MALRSLITDSTYMIASDVSVSEGFLPATELGERVRLTYVIHMLEKGGLKTMRRQTLRGAGCIHQCRRKALSTRT